MRPLRRWFLPREEDVLAELCEQMNAGHEAVCVVGEWVGGSLPPELATERLRALRLTGEQRRRAVHAAIRASFTTPLDAEDLFELAERISEVVEAAYALAREAELTDTASDVGLAGLVAAARLASETLLHAVRLLPAPAAASAVEQAWVAFQEGEHAYRVAVVGLRAEQDLLVQIQRRELYRRAEHLLGALARVGRRTWYSVAKVA